MSPLYVVLLIQTSLPSASSGQKLYRVPLINNCLVVLAMQRGLHTFEAEIMLLFH